MTNGDAAARFTSQGRRNHTERNGTRRKWCFYSLPFEEARSGFIYMKIVY